MKAVLHETQLERYEMVYDGQKLVELSGEAVVPDKMPDIGLLCDTNAHILLRSKRTEMGSAMLDGDVLLSVSYLSEGERTFQAVQLQLPCNADFNGELITGDSFAVGSMEVKQWETRMLNPRKILVKLQVECSARVYEKRSTKICDAFDGDGTVQVCRVEYPCTLISTVCERTFAATDEISLPRELVGGAILGKRVQYRTDDIKTLTNKLIVKGNVISDVVMAGQSGATEVFSVTTPFSLIADTDCEQVSDNVEIRIMPTAMYYELSGEGETLSIEVHGVCQMTAYGTRTVAYLSDAYSNFFPCTCDYDSLSVYDTMKKENHRENVSGNIACRSQLSCVRFLTATQTENREGITLCVGACVEYENGVMDWVKKQVALPFSPNNNERVAVVHISDLYGSCSGSEMLFRMNVEWESFVEEMGELKPLKSIMWDEDKPCPPREASFTVVRRGVELWELAKQYGSTVELIRTYNETEELSDPNGLLLIPRQRK